LTAIKKAYWILHTQLGIDPRTMLRSLCGVFRYIPDLLRFRSKYAGHLELMPCLNDWCEEGGDTKSEYFWQDLLVARKIFEANPATHVDIGSRVDGFVSHLASFREVEVFDIRPIDVKVPGIKFTQADLMNRLQEQHEYCDSLSCLHALEHFGLGRYGDPIDPEGFKHGLANMSHLLRNGGRFYLSVPIGIERVVFNANRVFDPRTIVRIADEQGLMLRSLTVIQEGGNFTEIVPDQSTLAQWATQRYALGLFIFDKCSMEFQKKV
jgi:hypothetical protein